MGYAMLKWASKRPDGVVLGFGLEPENIKLLQQGRPILALVSVGGVPVHIVIHAGETADAMIADLRQNKVLHLPQREPILEH